MEGGGGWVLKRLHVRGQKRRRAFPLQKSEGKKKKKKEKPSLSPLGFPNPEILSGDCNALSLAEVGDP